MWSHVLLTAVVLVTAGCALAAPVAPRPQYNSSARRSTCPSAYGPGKHTIELRVSEPGGTTWLRGLEIFVPDDMPLSDPRPSIVQWHGCGSDPEKFEDESQMDDRASRYLYYTAYPRGSTSQLTPETQLECLSGGGRSCGWNAGLSPGSCQTPTNPAPDDVFFAETVLEWMEQNLCVDMDRVFISGFSNGGQMAYKLNCELSERFAGVATNGMTPGAAYTPGAPTCMPTRQLPAINFCGSTDFVNCYGTDGSTIRTQVESFGRANGCTDEATRWPLSSTSFCFAAGGCPDGLPVQGCGIEGLAHCWPNYPGAGNANCQNQNPANVDASNYLLDFFNSLPSGSHWDNHRNTTTITR